MQGRAFLGGNLSPPREFVFAARDRMDERYDIIRAVRDNRYKYIRNYEPFKAYYQYMNTPEHEEAYFFAEDGHPNREGNRVIAQGILDHLIEPHIAR